MMMAAARHFIYRGGDSNVIPRDATHVSIDESVTVIPARLFCRHPNIVEVYCHVGVKRIENCAFYECPRLRRVMIPGIEEVEQGAFCGCEAMTYIECPKLERIEEFAFIGCKSLADINLPSASAVDRAAFYNCSAMMDAKFGTDLATIRADAFSNCHSLERITVPLKNGLFTHDCIFQECTKLKRVDLAEGEELHDTIDALLLEEWGNDINEVLGSINHILPETYSGYYYDDEEDEDGDVGEKARVIREWITRFLDKIIHYKAQHRHLLDSVTSTLQHVLPNDIVMNYVLPLLQLPSYTFDGEDEN